MLACINRRSAERVTAAGLIALAIANIGGYLMRRISAVSESVSDPLTGFMFGVAIALTLLGIIMRGRRVR